MTQRVQIPEIDPDSLRRKHTAKEFSVVVDGEHLELLVWPNEEGGFFVSERYCPHNQKVRLVKGQTPKRRDSDECNLVECAVHKWQWREDNGVAVYWGDEDEQQPRALKVWRVVEVNKVLYLVIEP